MKHVSNFLSSYLAAFVVIITVALCAVFLIFGTRSDDGSITLNGKDAKYSEAEKNAFCELDKQNDKAIAALTGIDVPQDSGSGCQPTDIPQLGAVPYYKVDVSTPAAFYNAVNGRGFNEGYGLQCVAAFKEFMFALSGKYVATNTGGASGYASQQGQIEPLGFKWHGGSGGLQDGDWGIFGIGQYGHVAMYYQGKWFGQNQGAANANAGNPFNLTSISTGSLIGYYRPNIYQKAAPVTPPKPSQPAPSANNTSAPAPTGSVTSYTIQPGDTLGDISLKLGWHGANGLFGDDGYTQMLAERNGIVWRGSIVPGAVIRRAE